MLRQNDAGAEARPVRAVIAFSNAVEAVAGSDHPRVSRRPLQILAKILKDGGMLWRQRSKIVDRLVDASGQTCRSHIMPQNSAVHNLRKKRGLRNKLPHQVRNIFLPLGRKSLLVPRSAPKRDDNNLLFLRRNSSQR